MKLATSIDRFQRDRLLVVYEMAHFSSPPSGEGQTLPTHLPNWLHWFQHPTF